MNMVKTVNICTAGECHGECYRCRLDNYRNQTESAIRFLADLLYATGHFGPWHDLWDSNTPEVRFIRTIVYPEWDKAAE